MDLINRSDSELEASASSILDELIKWGNNKNWKRWSQYFNHEGQSADIEQYTERQWEENPALCSFKSEKEFIGLVRRNGSVVTLWKMRSKVTDDDICGLLELEVEVKDIKVRRYNVF